MLLLDILRDVSEHLMLPVYPCMHGFHGSPTLWQLPVDVHLLNFLLSIDNAFSQGTNAIRQKL